MKTSFNNQTKKIFDENIQLTTIKEYGVNWEDLRTGKILPPPQGARFDLTFEGELNGPDLSGKIKGTDYLEVRSDGRFMLNIYATVITNDGILIALYEDGVAVPTVDEKAHLQLNLRFTSNSSKYDWLNTIQVWGMGSVALDTGAINVRAYTGMFIESPKQLTK